MRVRRTFFFFQQAETRRGPRNRVGLNRARIAPTVDTDSPGTPCPIRPMLIKLLLGTRHFAGLHRVDLRTRKNFLQYLKASVGQASKSFPRLKDFQIQKTLYIFILLDLEFRPTCPTPETYFLLGCSTPSSAIKWLTILLGRARQAVHNAL